MLKLHSLLPELNYGQSVFIEITNPRHGGTGWELGTCLWSPVWDKKRARAWRIMSQISHGDLIIHLVDVNDQYHWYGVSIVSSTLLESSFAPPHPDNWNKMGPYQRINLINFVRLSQPALVTDFFKSYDHSLRKIRKGQLNSFLMNMVKKSN